MEGFEKRKYSRLPLELEISCRSIGASAQKVHTGRTVNVCPGGLYFQTAACGFKAGSFLEVRVSIPPTPGLLEAGGTVAALAKVLRTENLRKSDTPVISSGGNGVAVGFCRTPKLCV